MQNVMELLELEMDMVRVLVGQECFNEDDDDLDDYYEDEDEEWGNSF